MLLANKALAWLSSSTPLLPSAGCWSAESDGTVIGAGAIGIQRGRGVTRPTGDRRCRGSTAIGAGASRPGVAGLVPVLDTRRRAGSTPAEAVGGTAISWAFKLIRFDELRGGFDALALGQQLVGLPFGHDAGRSLPGLAVEFEATFECDRAIAMSLRTASARSVVSDGTTFIFIACRALVSAWSSWFTARRWRDSATRTS